MKTTRNTFFKTISSMIVVLALVCTTNVQAQFGPPPGAEDTVDFEDNNAGVPLDGGLAVLIIGAAAIGIKKYRDNIKK